GVGDPHDLGVDVGAAGLEGGVVGGGVLGGQADPGGDAGGEQGAGPRGPGRGCLDPAAGAEGEVAALLEAERADVELEGPVLVGDGDADRPDAGDRSEEHTSELQSLTNLVCRLLLE